VTDFISIGTFPVFNVADSSITIGTAVLILGTWIKDRQEKRAAAQAAAEAPPEGTTQSTEEHGSDG
jgi:signal peptidase II